RRDVAAELLLRSARPDADRAADVVAAVGRALRTAQHLDAVDVDELLSQEAGRADLPDAVDVYADVRQAADAELRLARAAAAALNVDVRNVVADVFEAVEPLQLEGIAGQRHDRDRNLLQVLGAPRGCDDDLFQRSPFLCQNRRAYAHDGTQSCRHRGRQRPHLHRCIPQI